VRIPFALAPRCLAAACLLLAVACRPIRSSTLIVDAGAELAAARAAQAELLLPFEMTAADAYYHKALEEQAHADFDLAIRYARKSRDCALVAQARAQASTRSALGSTRALASRSARCRPGPERATPLPDADQEPNARGPAPAPAAPAREPADPPSPSPRKGPPGKAPKVKLQTTDPAQAPAAPAADEALPDGDADAAPDSDGGAP
jgi:hypothetical protein